MSSQVANITTIPDPLQGAVEIIEVGGGACLVVAVLNILYCVMSSHPIIRFIDTTIRTTGTRRRTTFIS